MCWREARARVHAFALAARYPPPLVLYLQKLNELARVRAYVQKLHELKSCGMCRYEADLYVQKLKSLENPAVEGSHICRYCMG